jgi:trk system potassium uptake protein TrkA
MENRFGIIGLGRFGSTIARKLSERGAEVMVFDKSEENVNALRDEVAFTACLDSTDIRVLKEQNITDLDAVVVAIGENFEALLLTTVNLLELGVKRVIARASTPQQKLVLEKIGVKEILSPEDEVGISVAGRLINPDLVSYFQLPDDYQIVELKVPPRVANKSVSEIDLRNTYQLNLITLRRAYDLKGNDGQNKREYHILGVPNSDTILYEEDYLLLLGKSIDIERFQELNR